MLKCPSCRIETAKEALYKSKYICPNCGFYLSIGSNDRINMILDKGSFVELYDNVEEKNPLNSNKYAEKIEDVRNKTGLQEAVITGTGRVRKEEIAIAVCDTAFMMGSMGYVVGEKITRLIEHATDNKLPIFIFCGSGGARMQEGIIALMQMEKTVAALKRHSNNGLFSCTILTNPTTGGVTASFAMLGDIVMAEPNALIGFTGPRVIIQTTREILPDGFQTPEFQEQHGMIDGIVERKDLRKMMYFFAVTCKKREGYTNFGSVDKKSLFKNLSFSEKLSKNSLDPWNRVKRQRGIERNSAIDYVKNIFDVFVELKGDRLYGNDSAILGGIAMLNRQPVMIIITNRGRNVDEMQECNYGMPMPEGYRKSLRLMKQAEKFNMPIITFINTPGAYPGVEAEKRGQGVSIANNLYELSDIKVPILAIITGEAGSGGALALAVANEVWMLENATYSIISPEGYASIVWKDASRASEAAKEMHITAEELKELKIIDKIIPEPEYLESSESVEIISKNLEREIKEFLSRMTDTNIKEILEQRYNRYRKY